LNFLRRFGNKNHHNTNGHKTDADALFSLCSAQITLETNLDLRYTGKAAMSLKSVSGRFFTEAVAEIKHFLDVSKADSDLSYRIINDSFGYLWIIFESSKIEDIILGISAVGQIIHDRSLAKQLLAALFQFSNKKNNNDANQYLVYNYTLNKFYPFAPLNENKRDDKIEREIMKTIVDELPVEKDVSLWYPIWNYAI
jgi:hypothetical protein